MTVMNATNATAAVENAARLDKQIAEKPRTRPVKARKGAAATVAGSAAAGSEAGQQAIGGDKDQPARDKATGQTKTDIVLKKLRLARGASLDTLMQATGWQAHSVRGFLSAVVRKKLGLTLVSETGRNGVRRYRIDDANPADTAG